MRPTLADQLDLQPHPEGGWFRQTWVSPETVTLPDGRVRPTATLIHFLLPAGESSAWHRVASDEIWLAHTGTVVLELGGSGAQPLVGGRLTVGVAVGAGEVSQALVPAGVWQRTVPSAADALVSCLVSPASTSPTSSSPVAEAAPDPRDPRRLRADAPLLDAWLSHRERSPHPFTIPGHKQRTDLVGEIVRDDVPLYGGLDEVKLSGGLLRQAEARAARLWGADLCRFSVGGSTHGNQTLALAVGRPGDRVVVQRTLHRSMLLGLVLAGLEPVWVTPDLDDSWGMPSGLAPETLTAALESAPDAKAVFVTDPSYVGTVGRIGELAEVAHAHGIPLVVDAAWAAHFGWHPDLPRHAIAQGADALVTSAHKTLPAWSQAALVLARTERMDPARLGAAFEATHTTSPAGAILASTDAAVALLEHDGPALLGRLIDLVAGARRVLAAVEGIVVLDGPHVDPVKLVVLLAGTGADGVLVERGLIEAGLPVEMADRDTVVALATLADDRSSIDRLVATLTALVERHRGEPRRTVPAASWSVLPVQGCSPREAFFAARERVALATAVGRISTELVAPYPPGVPVLAPGEVVTKQVVAALESARAAGVRIAYAADPQLVTLDVVADADMRSR